MQRKQAGISLKQLLYILIEDIKISNSSKLAVLPFIIA